MPILANSKTSLRQIGPITSGRCLFFEVMLPSGVCEQRLRQWRAHPPQYSSGEITAESWRYQRALVFMGQHPNTLEVRKYKTAILNMRSQRGLLH